MSDSNEAIKKAYEKLASATGVKIDYEDTEKFLRKFLGECAKAVLQERDWNLTVLKGRLTSIEKDIAKAEKYCKDQLKPDVDRCILEAEIKLDDLEKKIKAKQKELQKAENNPFLFEIISLTESLKARNIPDKEISEIVTTYITSLGYIRYKEAPKGETESEMLRRFAR
jgi:seryl-tRNA synthetase